MPFEQQIVRHEDCPRCNAVADVRIDDSTEEAPLPGVVMLVLVCPKCQLRRARGMTTKDILVLQHKEKALKKALQAGGLGQSDVRRIRAKLRTVQNKLIRKEMGL